MPDSEFGKYDFLDANHSFERSFKWAISAPEPKVNSPWRKAVPTLTAQSKMIARVRDRETGVVRIRRLHGLEVFALQGWGPQLWHSKNFPSNSLLCNLAVNMWDAGSFIPIAIAAFGAFPVTDLKNLRDQMPSQVGSISLGSDDNSELE